MAIAIVLAAGSGSRMHADIPKQYMKLAGREVLYIRCAPFRNMQVSVRLYWLRVQLTRRIAERKLWNAII